MSEEIDQSAAPPDFNSIGARMTDDVKSKFRDLMKDVPGVNPGLTPDQIAAEERARAAGVEAKPVEQQSLAVADSKPADSKPVDPSVPDPSADPAIPEYERPPSSAAKATKEDWMRFRKLKNDEVEKHRKEAEAFKAELESLRAKANGTSPELESLRKEKADLESRLERWDLANSPRFKSHYDGEIEKSLDLIKSVAGPHADEIIKLIQTPKHTPEQRTRLKELRDELGLDGDVIVTAAGKIRQLSLERDKQLANHSENLKLLRAKEAEEARERESKTLHQRQALADSILSRIKDLPEFKPDPALAGHSEFATQAVEFIRTAALGKLSNEDSALLPVAAMKATYLEKFRLPALQAEVKKLSDRIAELTRSSPKVDGQRLGGSNPSSKPSGGVAQAVYDSEAASRSVVEKFRELMGGG